MSNSLHLNQNPASKDKARPAGLISLGQYGTINSTSNCFPNFLKIPKTNEYRQTDRTESIRTVDVVAKTMKEYVDDNITSLKRCSTVQNRAEHT